MPPCLRSLSFFGILYFTIAYHAPSAAWSQTTEKKPVRPTAAFLALDRSPVAALLEAELLQHVEATWVERTEIGKVLDEQKLQALFAAEAVGERVRLGNLLKVDLLVLVRSGTKDQVAYLDVAVAESIRGLRLAHRRFPVSDDPRNDAAIVAKVLEAGFAKQRKPIEALFAVPPFVSNDLVHEYDDLRGTYARLIESQLLQQPNTLVVELAEAEAITRELSLPTSADLAGTSNKVSRLLPHYLVGRYRNQGLGKARCVKIQLALKYGPQQLAQSSGEPNPEDVPSFLQKEVGSVLKQLTGRTPKAADPKVEAEQLLLSANEHLKLGGFEEAVSLAEASLLLNPNQVEPHVVALRSLTPLVHKHWGYRNFRLDEVQLAMSFYLRGVHHIPPFFRNGGDLTKYRDGGQSNFLQSFYGASNGLNVHPECSPEVKQFMVAVREQHRDVMLEAIDLVVKQQPSLAAYFMNRGGWGLTEVQLSNLQRELILRYQHLPNARAITHELVCRGYTADVLNRPEGRALLDALEDGGNDHVKAEVAVLRKAVAARLAQREQERKTRESYSETLEPVPPGAERVSFQPVKLKTVDANGVTNELGLLDGLLATSAGFDIAWAGGRIFLMHRKGTLEQVFSSNAANSVISRPTDYRAHSGVCFDGSYVWAVCEVHQQDTRIIVIDPTTKQVSEITSEQGLPNPNAGNEGPNRVFNSLSLAAIAPGKILVAGGFGRAWLAEVEFKPGAGGKVRVFHEARETPDGSNREQWHDTSLSFVPGDIFTIAGSEPMASKSKRFLVGRDTTHVDALAHPLIVDPQTWTVEACAEQFWSQARGLERSPLNHSVYFVHVVPLQPQKIGLLRMGGPDLKVETVVLLPREGHVLAEPSRVHVVGKQWWIVDLKTKQVTPAGIVPWKYSNRLSASQPHLEKLETSPASLQLLRRSNHYGIIACYTGNKNTPSAIVQVMFEK